MSTYNFGSAVKDCKELVTPRHYMIPNLAPNTFAANRQFNVVVQPVQILGDFGRIDVQATAA